VEQTQKMRPLVLVVDDTPLARATIRRILEPRGYDVLEAGSTAEAVRLYTEIWPEVVTMDILMDGLNGIVAIQALQRIDHHVKIIVCSATADKSFVTGAAKLGVEAYLNKPIDAERLLAAVATAFAKTKSRDRPG
jgi:two-component system chemotaxis response regulator CheY